MKNAVPAGPADSPSWWIRWDQALGYTTSNDDEEEEDEKPPEPDLGIDGA